MLDEQGAEVGEERSTRNPLEAAEVEVLLASVREVVIARGRKAERRPAADVRPGDLRGPTGSFRAPIVRKGEVLLVGFHEESLRALV